MRILLDVQGGDLPPPELIKGGISAVRKTGIQLVFAGDPGTIRTTFARCHERECEELSILPTSQTIGMDEAPVRVVRDKRDSSLVQGLSLLKQGGVDAFVSPGNTGAIVVGSIFILGRLSGILRPGMAALIPTIPGREMIVIDVGANADCRPAHLEHFALMGVSYARNVMRIPDPRVGLLNIGEEKNKGNMLNRRAYDLLEQGPLRFVGNVEGHHMFIERPVDVVVCDGFIGNILVKALEGGVGMVGGLLKEMISRSLRAKLGARLLRPIFSNLRERTSYRQFGGAPLLGVNGVVVIAHGRSDALAIQGAIDVARRAVEADLNGQIERGIDEWGKNGG
ncbi:MAG: phosphate acyltransferase PlsX [Candidatus Bipolaricaulota bacterium]|nr:phosphate acyltransferase PlsX [Candidatus Bipolaricaulota bacterium]